MRMMMGFSPSRRGRGHAHLEDRGQARRPDPGQRPAHQVPAGPDRAPAAAPAAFCCRAVLRGGRAVYLSLARRKRAGHERQAGRHHRMRCSTAAARRGRRGRRDGGIGRSVTIDVRAGRAGTGRARRGHRYRPAGADRRRQACVSASDTGPRRCAALAERAVAMAREAPDDPACRAGRRRPAGSACARRGAGAGRPGPGARPGGLQAAAREAEAAALAVAGVTQVQSASAAMVAIATSTWPPPTASRAAMPAPHDLSCTAIAGTGTGMQRDGDGDSRIFRADLRGPADIGRSAGERAAARSARGTADRGLSGALRRTRLGLAHRASSGGGERRGGGARRQLAAGPAGRAGPARGPVADRGSASPARAASRLFDAEGLPTARRAIVEDGCCRAGSSTSRRRASWGWKVHGQCAARPVGPAQPGCVERGAHARAARHATT